MINFLTLLDEAIAFGLPESTLIPREAACEVTGVIAREKSLPTGGIPIISSTVSNGQIGLATLSNLLISHNDKNNHVSEVNERRVEDTVGVLDDRFETLREACERKMKER